MLRLPEGKETEKYFETGKKPIRILENWTISIYKSDNCRRAAIIVIFHYYKTPLIYQQVGVLLS